MTEDVANNRWVLNCKWENKENCFSSNYEFHKKTTVVGSLTCKVEACRPVPVLKKDTIMCVFFQATAPEFKSCYREICWNLYEQQNAFLGWGWNVQIG